MLNISAAVSNEKAWCKFVTMGFIGLMSYLCCDSTFCAFQVRAYPVCQKIRLWLSNWSTHYFWKPCKVATSHFAHDNIFSVQLSVRVIVNQMFLSLGAYLQSENQIPLNECRVAHLKPLLKLIMRQYWWLFMSYDSKQGNQQWEGGWKLCVFNSCNLYSRMNVRWDGSRKQKVILKV